MKRIISTTNAPEAVGAYSQATMNENLVFTAGQIPMTADGELLDKESIDIQTEQCLENLTEVLESEGLSMSDILKVSVFLDDIDDFEAMNDVYSGYFDEQPPARSAIEVANLPKGVGIEIEAIATAE